MADSFFYTRMVLVFAPRDIYGNLQKGIHVTASV